MYRKSLFERGFMYYWTGLGMLIGRICLSTIFILAGVGKFMDPAGTSAYMAAKGMTMVPFFLYAAALVEICGGLSLLLGFKARWGGLLLLLFLIPVTYIFHDFWNSDPAGKQEQMIMFLKNLAIFGGLFYVFSTGAGPLAFDAWCCKGERKSP